MINLIVVFFCQCVNVRKQERNWRRITRRFGMFTIKTYLNRIHNDAIFLNTYRGVLLT